MTTATSDLACNAKQQAASGMARASRAAAKAAQAADAATAAGWADAAAQAAENAVYWHGRAKDHCDQAIREAAPNPLLPDDAAGRRERVTSAQAAARHLSEAAVSMVDATRRASAARRSADAAAERERILSNHDRAEREAIERESHADR